MRRQWPSIAKTVFESAFANAQWRLVGRQRLNRAGFARFLAETAPTHVVANKLGRIVWAVWTKDVPYAAGAAA
jgi:hypothetical protein